MARAATGLTEVACWQFIGAGVGGVVALLFFLTLGALNGMEPKPKPDEKVAPTYVPSECYRWEDTTECNALKDKIDVMLTDGVKQKLKANPCSLDVSPVVSDLGFYWQVPLQTQHSRAF